MNINPVGLRVEYVELYPDDWYMGFYGLCRPISRDSLGISARDTLISGEHADGPHHAHHRRSF